MKSAALYTPEQNERIQLGLKATRPEDAPTTLLVAITANLVATNAPQLVVICGDGEFDGRSTVELDFTHCAYIDKAGWGALLQVAHRANKKGGCVTVHGAHRDILTLFVSHGLAEFFRFDVRITLPGEVLGDVLRILDATGDVEP